MVQEKEGNKTQKSTEGKKGNPKPGKSVTEKKEVTKTNEYTSTIEGGNKTMTFASIAIVLSIIAILISLILVFTLRQDQTNANEEITKELSEKLKTAFDKIEVLENQLIEVGNEGEAERTGRGLLELRKALLSFQEARSLIRDDDLVRKLLKIEDEMKSILRLPDAKEVEKEIETEVEGTEEEAKTEEKKEELKSDTAAEESVEPSSQTEEDGEPEKMENVKEPETEEVKEGVEEKSAE